MPSCGLLYSQQRFDEFIVCAKHVLFSSCGDLAEKSVMRGMSYRHTMQLILSLSAAAINWKLLQISLL